MAEEGTVQGGADALAAACPDFFSPPLCPPLKCCCSSNLACGPLVADPCLRPTQGPKSLRFWCSVHTFPDLLVKSCNFFVPLSS